MTEKTQTAHKRTKICSISSIIRRKITGNNPNIIRSRRINRLGCIQNRTLKSKNLAEKCTQSYSFSTI